MFANFGGCHLIQEAQAPSPITPRKANSNYYREHTHMPSNTSAMQAPPRIAQTASPATSHMMHGSVAAMQMSPTSARPLTRSLSQPYAHLSELPVTPQLRRVYTDSHVGASPLPASSPPPASSPFSSPTKPIVNIVSSPGPIGPAPLEDDYSDLPYTLPPGPYSSTKPDLSYAALIGQAVLSSPEHRLTLQEIYDWITIVYPYFKRGETTWMNSIRHVLSTTICFRKVPRERSVGRTLWAIWDEDLPCFEGGGFKKYLCREMVAAAGANAKVPASRPRARKREAETDGDQKSKRQKKAQNNASNNTYSYAPTTMPVTTMPPQMHHSHSLPLFPPTRPTPHHQPYYQSCIPAPMPLPNEIIFPPLPPSSAAYHQFLSGGRAIPQVTPTSSNASAASSEELIPSFAYPPSSGSSHMGVPELTPNRSSSSPPLSLLSTSTSSHSQVDEDTTKVVEASGQSELTDDQVFSGGLSKKSFGDLEDVAPLEPGILLLNFDYDDDMEDGDEESVLQQKERSTKKKKQDKMPLKMTLPPMPASPTLNCKGASSSFKALSFARQSPAQNLPPRLSTPPPKTQGAMPCTPPRNRQLTSPTHTPLSHKGLHMSPSPSLAHYKSNLDPPPVIAFNRSGETMFYDGDENHHPRDADEDGLRTPSRTRKQSSNLGYPVTPKKLVFPSASSGGISALGDSPFRTPSRGLSLGLGSSPFRTPTSRAISDPHDPRTLLDEELSRMGTQDSPMAGLFGRTRGALLYESPNPRVGNSPMTHWW
ncbi:hypothetical protein HGRIS_004829 [Hohenbuehelia grisea]|uniref:Fork-head domain-containing protein n=1 Tax=Hohenbuehelia grisea TaxID=104357 RepID=A0ABR3JDX9_9AGAR